MFGERAKPHPAPLQRRGGRVHYYEIPTITKARHAKGVTPIVVAVMLLVRLPCLPCLRQVNGR